MSCQAGNNVFALIETHHHALWEYREYVREHPAHPHGCGKYVPAVVSMLVLLTDFQRCGRFVGSWTISPMADSTGSRRRVYASREAPCFGRPRETSH